MLTVKFVNKSRIDEQIAKFKLGKFGVEIIISQIVKERLLSFRIYVAIAIFIKNVICPS